MLIIFLMSRINEFNGLWQWHFEVEKILIQIVRARMSYSSLRSYTITTCNLPARCYKLEILQRLNFPRISYLLEGCRTTGRYLSQQYIYRSFAREYVWVVCNRDLLKANTLKSSRRDCVMLRFLQF